MIVLFIFNGANLTPQLFLAPRGLITILLFFAIPEKFSLGSVFQGVLLFVVLVSCLIMSWGLISRKHSLAKKMFNYGGITLLTSSAAILVNLRRTTSPANKPPQTQTKAHT